MQQIRFLVVAVTVAFVSTVLFVSPTLATHLSTDIVGQVSDSGVTSISLDVTVSTIDVCGDADSITVNQGDELYFCYTVLNTGSKPLRFHSLSDTAFGHILSDVHYELWPHTTFELVKGPYVADQSFTNDAGWSAKRWQNTLPVTSTDMLEVTVIEQQPATVTVAHFAPFAGSVDATSVSVLVNKQVALENFKFGAVEKNVELPAGHYHIEIVPTGGNEAAISGDVTVEAGMDYTLAAIGDGVNQKLELLPLVDDNMPADEGAKLRIAHLSPFAADLEATKVDICTDDDMVVAGGLAYKGVINPVLPAGDYDLKIAVANSECMSVVLDLPSIRLVDGDIFELYAVGIPGGPIDFTVAAHPELVLTPEPEQPATVTVAHFAPFAGSVDATSVSVLVNKQVALENFKFGAVEKNVELPAGHYHIEIVPTGGNEAAISGDVTVEAGMDYTLAAIGDGVNQKLELLPLVDDNMPADEGAKLRIAHLSPFAADLEATKVDICTDDDMVVAGGLAYKGVINPVLPAGDYDLKIAVANSECMSVVLDLPSIRLVDGDIFELYAVGIPGGPIDFTVAAHPELVLTPEPEQPATVTVAHFAPFAGSVDATSVSVLVNKQVALENFKFGAVEKNVELPAGHYHIEIVPTGGNEAAISGDVTVEAGMDYTLAAIGDGVNQKLELLPLVDDNMPADEGAKLRIAHLSPFAADLEATKVDICTDDDMVVAGGLAYKGVINPVLPAGDYDLRDRCCKQ